MALAIRKEARVKTNLSEAEKLFLEAAIFVHKKQFAAFGDTWAVVKYLFERLPPESRKRTARALIRYYLKYSADKNWLQLMISGVDSSLLLELIGSLGPKLRMDLILEEARRGHSWFVEHVAAHLKKGERILEQAFLSLADAYAKSATYSETEEKKIVRIARESGYPELAQKLAERFKERTRKSKKHIDAF